ncbi:MULTISPECIES: fimbrial protein [Providencia]|uniref:Fimbrial protein n=4 Tax=Providencia huaxiensis TaxID=2027290 RepID=A0A345LYK5_9GAMM|nr:MULTISPECIES: fimbrial protein [Providencia]MBZ3680964.1 fimbrial protein [Providencia rettgeri]AXH63195.1 fimbrial protein [Providencia huaxiensis]MBN6360195.1 fimbrial protein [Providencia huaxiensis]MBQ0269334.1 fimbrial protein [Providencia huaxiensis]MBQ0533632.1 fimbrial protein [Providencia huaxiensis]
MTKKKTLLVIIGSAFAYSAYTQAACIQNPNLRNVVVNVPARTYSLQYDDTGARDLATIQVNFKSSHINTYSGPMSNGRCGDAYLHADYVNGWVPNGNKIATSNIPGISIQVKATEIGFLNTRYGPPTGANPAAWGIPNPYWTITIKKTGQVTQGGNLKAGHVGRLTQRNPAPHNSTWNLTSLNIPAGAIKINVLKCSTKANSYNVNLGTWYDTQFKSVGSTSNSVNIPITLSCAAGTNLKVTVTSSAGYVDTNTGKIKLSGQGQATGVAIQLLDRNSNPIKLNSKFTLQNNVAGGDYIFNWKARYIKTANNITAGTANSTASVNIRYE